MAVTISYNPYCGTSRNTLAVGQSGVKPQIIDYRLYPPARERLEWLIAQAGLTTR